jgi:ParB/RepB/Spo0J family partition protein
LEKHVESLYDLPLDEILSDETFNVRGHITPSSVGELSKDIEKDGLIQPIVVQPWLRDRPAIKYRVVAGHRRYLATRLLCMRRPDLPKVIKARIMEGLTDEMARVINFKENLGRENLNILQEAKGLVPFIEAGWTDKRIAEEIGVYKKWVEARLALLRMPEDIQARAEGNFLTQNQILDIAGFSTDQEKYDYVKKCVDHKLMGPKVPKKSKNKKPKVNTLSKESRPQGEIFAVQEVVQDTMQDNAHPAAIALGFAAGAITLDEFYKHLGEWAKAEGLQFVPPAKVA